MAGERVAPEAVEKVAVLGAGTIGASWTALFLAHGLEVAVYDVSPDIEAYVRDYVETAWPALEKLGLTEGGDPGRVGFHASPTAAVEGAHFVQENVPERLEVKHETYRAIEPALAPETVVASSASGLLVRDMQLAFRHPERFVLAHPFNPPHLIPLVELLGNERSDAAAVAWAEGFYARCGKVTILLHKEVPGHVANRLQAALWREAIHLVLEGVASVEDVDKAIVHGPGLRWAVMGPHMLFNLASGGHGFAVFCERFGGSFHHWWESLGAPWVTPDVVQTLARGIEEEEAGRDFAALAAERDDKLVALRRTLDAFGPEGGRGGD